MMGDYHVRFCERLELKYSCLLDILFHESGFIKKSPISYSLAVLSLSIEQLPFGQPNVAVLEFAVLLFAYMCSTANTYSTYFIDKKNTYKSFTCFIEGDFKHEIQ